MFLTGGLFLPIRRGVFFRKIDGRVGLGCAVDSWFETNLLVAFFDGGTEVIKSLDEAEAGFRLEVFGWFRRCGRSAGLDDHGWVFEMLEARIEGRHLAVDRVQDCADRGEDGELIQREIGHSAILSKGVRRRIAKSLEGVGFLLVAGLFVELDGVGDDVTIGFFVGEDNFSGAPFFEGEDAKGEEWGGFGFALVNFEGLTAAMIVDGDGGIGSAVSIISEGDGHLVAPIFWEVGGKLGALHGAFCWPAIVTVAGADIAGGGFTFVGEPVEFSSGVIDDGASNL